MTASTSKPTLLLDMDGPLADFDQRFWELCQQNDWPLDIDSLDDPGRHRFMTDNLTFPQHRRAARNVINDTNWFAYLPVTEGATEGVPELMEHFDVWVCTKPLEANRWCRDDKAMWIARHFPGLLDRLIITPNKGLVHGDVLLDDAPKASWIVDETTSWQAVIFPAPFNGPGTVWGELPRWTWGDPVDELLAHASPQPPPTLESIMRTLREAFTFDPDALGEGFRAMLPAGRSDLAGALHEEFPKLDVATSQHVPDDKVYLIDTTRLPTLAGVTS